MIQNSACRTWRCHAAWPIRQSRRIATIGRHGERVPLPKAIISDRSDIPASAGNRAIEIESDFDIFRDSPVRYLGYSNEVRISVL